MESLDSGQKKDAKGMSDQNPLRHGGKQRRVPQNLSSFKWWWRTPGVPPLEIFRVVRIWRLRLRRKSFKQTVNIEIFAETSPPPPIYQSAMAELAFQAFRRLSAITKRSSTVLVDHYHHANCSGSNADGFGEVRTGLLLLFASALWSRAERAGPDPPGAFGPTLTSPFRWRALTEGIQRRAESTGKLEAYLQEAAAALRAVKAYESRPGSAARMDMLREDVALSSEQLLYGEVAPHSRQAYLRNYGCARWTESALALVAGLGGIIEIGAGGGHWAKALRESPGGCDILAFDNRCDEIPGGAGGESVPLVMWGDPGVVPAHPDRTLFLCYPPPAWGAPGAASEPAECMATACLRVYSGDTLIYVGEGRGGATASATFFDALEEEWNCVQILSLDPFPECFEHLFVFRRKTTEDH